MNELEKKNTKVEKNVEVDKFKSVSDMNVTELNTLIPVTYMISKVERKKQHGTFSYTAHCDINGCNGLGQDFYLKESDFVLIEIEKKCDPNFKIHNFLHGSCQIIKGKRKNDDSTFYFIEVALTPTITRSQYMDESACRLLDTMYGKKLPIIDRTNIVAVKDFVPFTGAESDVVD